jgi:hypothetical protein
VAAQARSPTFIEGDGNDPGGLLRWDRQQSTVQHWDVPWIATSIARAGEAITSVAIS